MANDDLPSAVKQLLARYIRSVEQLEVLLLIASQSSRTWTASDVYEVIRSSKASIADRLQAFTNDGFLVEEQTSPPRFSLRAEERGATPRRRGNGARVSDASHPRDRSDLRARG
jgi:hypothetical protein